MTHRNPKIRHHVYRDSQGDYRWKAVHENSRIMADSGEGYDKLEDCIHGLVEVTNVERSDIIMDS